MAAFFGGPLCWAQGETPCLYSCGSAGFKYPAVFDMMLRGLHDREHGVRTSGDSPDKNIAGQSRSGDDVVV